MSLSCFSGRVSAHRVLAPAEPDMLCGFGADSERQMGSQNRQAKRHADRSMTSFWLHSSCPAASCRVPSPPNPWVGDLGSCHSCIRVPARRFWRLSRSSALLPTLGPLARPCARLPEPTRLNRVLDETVGEKPRLSPWATNRLCRPSGISARPRSLCAWAHEGEVWVAGVWELGLPPHSFCTPPLAPHTGNIPAGVCWASPYQL